MAYETLTFRLAEGSYGARAVAIGEVPLRVGLTQFLESFRDLVRPRIRRVGRVRPAFLPA